MYDNFVMNQSETPYISVVVPVYGSDEVLGELYERTAKTLESITPNFEFIFVNDASPDNAWEIIKKLKLSDERIRGINLSRNFGQYPALTAGLRACRGEWIVVMDCDLQDLPEAIERMYQKAQEGFYVVVGSRQERHDSRLRLFVSWGFYATLGYLTGRQHDRTLANFGIYQRRVIDAVLSIEDHMRYFSVMVRWVGFRTAVVPVKHAPRKGGVSGYSFMKLFSLATDIILAYSEKPLRIIVRLGALVTIVAAGYLVLVTTNSFDVRSSQSLETLTGSLWLIFGLLTTLLGIIALYVGKIFEETKKRPIYIVQEEI
ncbi:MAG: glycosyltransferase involved in cell wall biosynthesis [Candidatus Azotimanducaceae bacterium]